MLKGTDEMSSRTVANIFGKPLNSLAFAAVLALLAALGCTGGDQTPASTGPSQPTAGETPAVESQTAPTTIAARSPAATLVPTNTALATPDQSTSETATPEPSPRATAPPSPIPTLTLLPSPHPTPPSTAVPTPRPTMTPTPPPTPTAVPAPTPPPTSLPTAVPAPIPTATPTPPPDTGSPDYVEWTVGPNVSDEDRKASIQGVNIAYQYASKLGLPEMKEPVTFYMFHDLDALAEAFQAKTGRTLVQAGAG